MSTVQICTTANLVPTIVATILFSYLLVIGIEWLSSKIGRKK